ncbi:MAG: hypothetical protein U0003_02285, partial [Vampirovibrionales bacterium]
AVVNDVQSLDDWINKRLNGLANNGPTAIKDAKDLVNRVCQTPAQNLETLTSQWIAQRRASVEGKEGIAAFLEKRSPQWA